MLYAIRQKDVKINEVKIGLYFMCSRKYRCYR